MGDQNDRFSSSKVVNRLHNRALGDVVERAGSLIHDDEIRIAIESAGDADTLALPPRESDTAFSNRRVVALLQLARDAATRVGVEARTNFVTAEFLGHDFGDHTFDVSIAMGVFDYLEEPEPFLAKMARLTRGKVIASFPRSSLVRAPMRRLRYRLTGRGDVFYYTASGVSALAARAWIDRHRLIHLYSSGGGFILVGDNS